MMTLNGRTGSKDKAVPEHVAAMAAATLARQLAAYERQMIERANQPAPEPEPVVLTFPQRRKGRNRRRMQ